MPAFPPGTLGGGGGGGGAPGACARFEPTVAAAFTRALSDALGEMGAGPEEALQRERFKLFEQGAEHGAQSPPPHPSTTSCLEPPACPTPPLFAGPHFHSPTPSHRLPPSRTPPCPQPSTPSTPSSPSPRRVPLLPGRPPGHAAAAARPQRQQRGAVKPDFLQFRQVRAAGARRAGGEGAAGDGGGAPACLLACHSCTGKAAAGSGPRLTAWHQLTAPVPRSPHRSYVGWKVAARHVASPEARSALCARVGELLLAEVAPGEADGLRRAAARAKAGACRRVREGARRRRACPLRPPPHPRRPSQRPSLLSSGAASEAEVAGALTRLLSRLEACGYACGWQLVWGDTPGGWPSDWHARSPGLIGPDGAPAAPGDLPAAPPDAVSFQIKVRPRPHPWAPRRGARPELLAAEPALAAALALYLSPLHLRPLARRGCSLRPRPPPPAPRCCAPPTSRPPSRCALRTTASTPAASRR
jgi:hypothetical protein